MTFAEVLKKAVTERDPVLFGKWMDGMRDLGATYQDCLRSAQRNTDISAEDFETLAEEADQATSEEVL